MNELPAAEPGPETAPPPQAPRRPWRVPLALLAVALLGWFAWPLWDWFDLDPYPYRALHAGGTVLAALIVVGLLVWFFVERPAPGWVAPVGIVLGGGVLFLLVAVDGFDVTGELAAVPHFRWETSPEAALREYLNDLDGEGLPAVDAKAGRLDSPCYRGPERDGAAPDVVFDHDWGEPPRLLWRHPCGAGFSGFAVAGNVAVTAELRGKKEAVVCYDRASGKQRWATEFADAFLDFFGSGPRATPTIHGGSVFALGAKEGTLARLDARSGKAVWSTNSLSDCGAERLPWGMASSPLVLGDEVLVNVGVKAGKNAKQALAAYSIETGVRVWSAGERPAGYSSPMRVKVAGGAQILLLDAGGLAGYGPLSHEELWRHDWPTHLGLNMAQPLVFPGRGHCDVLISSGPAEGAALVRVSQLRDGTFSAEEVWRNRNLAANQSSPVRLNQWVFGLSNGTLVCLDGETGRRMWRGRYYGHGQLLALNGAVLVLGEAGEVALVSGDARAFRELGRFQALRGRTWNVPALAGRQLFVRNDREMACYELPLLKPRR